MKNKKAINIGILLLSFLFTFMSILFLGYGMKFLFGLTFFITVGLTLVLVLNNREEVSRFFSSKKGKDSFYSLIVIMTSFVVIVLVYLLFYFGLFKWTYDFSKESIYTLSNETKEYLLSIDHEVKIEILENKNALDYLQNILRMYQEVSSEISIEYIDPFSRPEIVENYPLDQKDILGAVVLYGKEKEPLFLKKKDFFLDTQGEEGLDSKRFFLLELKLNNAIRTLFKKEKKVVGFYNKEVMRSAWNRGNNGFSELARSLVIRGLEIREIKLENTQELQSVDLLILGGLRKDLSLLEIEILEYYVLENKGSLVYLGDSTMDRRYLPIDRVNRFFEQLGVLLRDDLVIDPLNYLNRLESRAGGFYIPKLQIQNHPALLSLLKEQFSVYFFTAQSLSLNLQHPQYYIQSLLETYKNAYGERNYQKQESAYTPGVDYLGPLTLGASLQDRETRQRMVVLGDSAFVSNYMIYNQANKEVMVRLILWALGQDEFPNFSKGITQKYIPMPFNVQMIIVLFFIILFPFTFLILGFAVPFIRGRRFKK